MKKRIICVMLSLLLVAGSVLSRVNIMTVKASGALSLEASAEITEILYTLLINGMIAAGASNIDTIDYSSAGDLYTSFLDSMATSMGLPGSTIDASSVKVVSDDGSVVTLEDMIMEYYVDGTGALQFPDEATWCNYQVVNGGGTGSSGDDNQNPEDPFTEIEKMKIGTEFLAYMGAWIKSLWDGAVDGLDRDAYFFPDLDSAVGALPQYYFDGSYDMDVDGNYVIKGYILTSSNGIDILTEIDFIFNSLCVACFKNDALGFFYYDNKLVNIPVASKVSNYKDGVLTSSYTSSGTNYFFCDSYIFKVPVFSSQDAALSFLQNGDTSGILNGLTYDYPDLADSVAQALNPLAGIYFSPNALPAVYPAISAAVDALPDPEPASDPSANTDTYVAAVTDAVSEVVPEALPDPDAGTETEPEPDPAEETEMDAYKTDLTMIFPFCLPFDFIHFLQVMDAEPVTPVFEMPFVVPALDIDMTVTLDMSFLDPVMEVFRFGETVSFLLMLIAVSSKLIKW